MNGSVTGSILFLKKKRIFSENDQKMLSLCRFSEHFKQLTYLVLLLVYAFQPERPAAPTAAAAKVIRNVRNLSYDSKNIQE